MLLYEPLHVQKKMREMASDLYGECELVRL